MMLMRSLSPLLAPPNRCYASQFVSRHFSCRYRWHWRAAAVPGIYRGLSPPAASAPSSLCPCLLPRILWHGKGLLQVGAAQAAGMGWPRALTLPKRSHRTLLLSGWPWGSHGRGASVQGWYETLPGRASWHSGSPCHHPPAFPQHTSPAPVPGWWLLRPLAEDT